MKYETRKENGFYIVGISCRTINQGGQSSKDIGELWGRFYEHGVPDAIPNKIDKGIYNIYTDYESDHNGYYTTLLGCKVSSLDTIPKGLVGKHIPAATYNLYVSQGKLPDCVMATWQNIWQSGIKRGYIVDFDYYGADAQDPANARVETYLSVKA